MLDLLEITLIDLPCINYNKRARKNYFSRLTMNSVNIFNTTTLVMAVFAIQTMIFGELL